jgi:peptide chain release factor
MPSTWGEWGPRPMELNERFDVSDAKVEELRARIARLAIDVRAIEEQFVRGGGPGGQKTNKTSNGVVLRYAPLGLVVRCRRDRRRSVNRFLALRELVDQVEMRVSPSTSERLRERDRVRARKDRARRRRQDKGAGGAPAEGTSD